MLPKGPDGKIVLSAEFNSVIEDDLLVKQFKGQLSSQVKLMIGKVLNLLRIADMDLCLKIRNFDCSEIVDDVVGNLVWNILKDPDFKGMDQFGKLDYVFELTKHPLFSAIAASEILNFVHKKDLEEKFNFAYNEMVNNSGVSGLKETISTLEESLEMSQYERDQRGLELSVLQEQHSALARRVSDGELSGSDAMALFIASLEDRFKNAWQNGVPVNIIGLDFGGIESAFMNNETLSLFLDQRGRILMAIEIEIVELVRKLLRLNDGEDMNCDIKVLPGSNKFFIVVYDKTISEGFSIAYKLSEYIAGSDIFREKLLLSLRSCFSDASLKLFRKDFSFSSALFSFDGEKFKRLLENLGKTVVYDQEFSITDPSIEILNIKKILFVIFIMIDEYLKISDGHLVFGGEIVDLKNSNVNKLQDRAFEQLLNFMKEANNFFETFNSNSYLSGGRPKNAIGYSSEDK